MALKKELTTNQGLVADYWKVDMVTIDKNNIMASCVLHLYKDKETSKTDKKDAFADSRYVTISTGIDYSVYEGVNDDGTVKEVQSIEDIQKENFEKYFGEDAIYVNMYEACYNMAKELDIFFADAEDC